MKNKTTIHDIARGLNVSPSTVSRALRDHPRISKKTIAAVKDLAEKMNYQHNGIAAALRVGKSRMIGVVIPTTNRNFFGNVLRGIEKVAAENDYTVLITQSNDDFATERNIIKNLLRAHVDGIILSISKTTNQFGHFKKVKNAGLPLILFDRIFDEFEASSVTIDDYGISYKATNHLIQQGYHKIVHFSGPQNINIYKNRRRGYLDALDDANINLAKDYIRLSSDLGISDGRRLMEELLGEGMDVDAVLAASDYSAAGAMQVCKERNINIPDEIGFIGFANEPFTQLIEPGLTTIDQKPEEMGMLAAQLFFQEINNNKDFIARNTVLTPNLIIRGSSVRKHINR